MLNQDGFWTVTQAVDRDVARAVYGNFPEEEPSVLRETAMDLAFSVDQFTYWPMYQPVIAALSHDPPLIGLNHYLGGVAG
jgi:hypothetical protein